MTADGAPSVSGEGRRGVLSVDAMGGDLGPEAVVAGLAKAVRANPAMRVLLHGPEDELRRLVARRRGLSDHVTFRDAQGVVSMTDKPGQVLRNGKDTSMWSAVEAVRAGEAEVCVSCGNTGALMAISTIRLRKLPGVARPAIACLWPSRNPAGFNVVLDVGADIRADAEDLLRYALMGMSYARNGLGLERPRVGLLNVGTEEHKGRPELREAHDRIEALAEANDFAFVGFVEGGDIPSDGVDVIVTDGFTGNVALKTGEGTARFVRDMVGEAFRAGPLSKLGALLSMRGLNAMRARIDPRRVNGGVFLGLNGTVVKSHGSSDETGVAAAVGLAWDLSCSEFSDRLRARVTQATGTMAEAES
ncbi:phosphate acyltransferase PlsX [Jannaschia sp. W003]|uniref:phosphate acyltransferase PlsX n=1 Tax=Jannaschia sp. W003 TaxID=2867012 RepID=UPI0021A2BBF6|nr:phosphate acyltransferase PlsX [Jannaschia sp. W003]UWQ20704.1 phosphate acyltransferase PlsX [Jannaschia sp. W003]